MIEDCTRAADIKIFAAIEFKQKWIMPFCSLAHLASDWHLTFITQINLRLSNQLVNINHLYLPRQKFPSVFHSRQNIKCQVCKNQSYIISKLFGEYWWISVSALSLVALIRVLLKGVVLNTRCAWAGGTCVSFPDIFAIIVSFMLFIIWRQ